jgi:Tfp pilus assembly protein PilZ
MSGWRQPFAEPQQKFPRLETCVPVRIATVDPETDPDTGLTFFRNTEATTANLSRGGAFVHSWEPLAAGRRVIVALDLPSGGELALVGRVVWTRRKLAPRLEGPLEAPGYGIEFEGGSRAEQAAIQQILDVSAPVPGPLEQVAVFAATAESAPTAASPTAPTTSTAPKATSPRARLRPPLAP